MELRYHIVVKGRVQGVGFRFFTQDAASALGLTGWVKNAFTGDVEIDVQGLETRLAIFEQKISHGPSLARVDELIKTEIPLREEDRFKIR
ncbi:MAG: acylphosphatase [Lentisphaeria bacterium]|nr:acylphosphatase [Lentisphaeria bacterium]NQZ68601.1 acylphosphatase [Lentisphaeria bacterium]